MPRLAGTIVGVALAWVVFTLHPAVIVAALVAVLEQFPRRGHDPRLYGLGMIFVSVLALSTYDLAVPSADLEPPATAAGCRGARGVPGAIG